MRVSVFIASRNAGSHSGNFCGSGLTESRLRVSSHCPAKSKNLTRAATSFLVTGRRYARRARVDTIRWMQAGPEFGSQIRIFLRLAFSTLVGNGPMNLMELRYLFFLSL